MRGREPLGPAMEAGAWRGPETPRGVALTGRLPPLRPSEGLVLAPAEERPLCDGEAPAATAGTPAPALAAPTDGAGAGAGPPEEAGTEPLGQEPPGLEQPCSPGRAEPCTAEPALPVPVRAPAEPPSQRCARGSCLIRNWQEERATNELDGVPSPELGSEGYFYRHGHRGLLAHQLPSRLANSTTMKDSYRQPWRTALPARGQREAMLELMLYQKYREEVQEEACPPPAPMESLSTTHRHYRAEGFQPAPLPPTQPHDCYTEQPCSYWLEQARRVPGVTTVCAANTPFRRNAAFSTPVTEQRGQPLP